MGNYTQVEEVGDFEGAENRWSCNDCGAHGTVKEQIVHHATCTPGESKKWEDFYTAPENQEVYIEAFHAVNCSTCARAVYCDYGEPEGKCQTERVIYPYERSEAAAKAYAGRKLEESGDSALSVGSPGDDL